MGRWLDELKEFIEAEGDTPQNLQNPSSGGFEGFEGANPNAEGNAFALGDLCEAKEPAQEKRERCFSDAEMYADALRVHGPMSYGMAMEKLGWGATRAGQAESVLWNAGHIRFNALGRAVLAEIDEGDTR